ncbi:MAG: restriction endonuclease subunit S [Bacteroidales bacterium]|jgi:type I restriction enzyme S subunit|nr:restriction endonuclease subunit S [Bacteroidales bacterium]
MKILIRKLEEIADVIAGQSPPSVTYNEKGDGLPFFQGKTDFGEKHPTIRIWCSEPKKIALPNDILISVRAPVGPVNIANKKSCIGRGLSAIRTKEGNSIDFLFYFLKSNERLIAKNASGSTFSAITQKDLKELKIPIPEKLKDQIHIANVLSRAETLITKRKESIQLLDELLKSTFLDMFGDPVRNEKGWEKKATISYADCIVPGRDKPKSFTGDIPWVTTDDLEHLSTTIKSKKDIGLLRDEIKQVKARLIPKDSVLMTCVGDLGVISLAGQDMVVNQQLHSFQCKEDINNKFLMFALSYQKKYMYRKASKTTVPYMNKTICNSIPVIKPPLELQNKFAQIVEKVEKIKTKYQEGLQELENLYASLSQKAFSSAGNLLKAGKGELDLSKMEIEQERLDIAAEEGVGYGKKSHLKK